VVCSAPGSAPRPPVRGTSSRASATISAAAVCLAGAASAQTPPPASANVLEVEEIVITGSRIASPNATSASPIQVLNSQEIQASGKTDLSDILYQLPQLQNNDLGKTSATARLDLLQREVSRPPTCGDWARTARWCW